MTASSKAGESPIQRERKSLTSKEGGAFENLIRVPLRWRDLDYQGHVYHAEFLTIADEARTQWLGERLKLRNPHECVIVSLKIDYLHEISRHDGAVDVSIAIKQLGKHSITTEEVFTSPLGTTIAELTCVLIPWDPETREKIPLSDEQRTHALANLMVMSSERSTKQ